MSSQFVCSGYEQLYFGSFVIKMSSGAQTMQQSSYLTEHIFQYPTDNAETLLTSPGLALFDCVMLVMKGIQAVKLQGVTRLISPHWGTSLMNALRRTSFTGITGAIVFRNGSNDNSVPSYGTFVRFEQCQI
jgi:hypothetical protein